MRSDWSVLVSSVVEAPAVSLPEVARGYAVVPVRDSKVSHGPAVIASTASWSAFVTAVRNGSLDLGA
ncbi:MULTISPECIES: DUF397 domain-containing protein [Streptomyces]